jgi:hypothetical protein
MRGDIWRGEGLVGQRGMGGDRTGEETFVEVKG